MGSVLASMRMKGSPVKSLPSPAVNDSMAAQQDSIRLPSRAMNFSTLAVVVACAIYLAWSVLAPDVGQALHDEWLYCTILAGCSLAVLARAVASPVDRLGWIAMALAIAAWFCGAVLYNVWVSDQETVRWPSIADFFYLSFYPLALLALFLLLRERARYVRRTVALDALIVALGLGAYVSMEILKIIPLGEGPIAGILTNAAYPAGDLVLLCCLTGMLAVMGWSFDRMWLWLAAAFITFSIFDMIYFSDAVVLMQETGPELNSGWIVGFVLISGAAYSDTERMTSTSKRSGALDAVVPALVAFASLALLVAGNFWDIPRVSTALAVAAVLAGALRGGIAANKAVVANELREQSVTDGVTKLGNRRALYATLDDLIVGSDGAEELSLLIVRVRSFREINSEFGEAQGDSVLRELGNRLRSAISGTNYVYRIGGGEFCLIHRVGYANDSVAALMKRLEALMAEPVSLSDIQMPIRLTVGVAHYPEHARSRGELLQKADAAMTRAAEQDLSYAVFDSDIDSADWTRIRMTQQLRDAVENREFVLYYQPKLTISSNTVSAVEALVRWKKPDEGLVFPDTFLPIAENAGIMRLITETVLEAGIAQAAQWRADGLPLVVALNLSMTDLHDLGLPTTVKRLLAKHELPASTIQFEVTETVVMTDPARARVVIDELHQLGIGISVDDFGKANSSLFQLRELSAQQIKLDRELVTGLNDDEELRAIVASTTQLAHSLGIQMVAEGVETESDLQALRELGCDLAQGYYIRRPGPADEITAWLSERSIEADAVAGSIPVQGRLDEDVRVERRVF